MFAQGRPARYPSTLSRALVALVALVALLTSCAEPIQPTLEVTPSSGTVNAGDTVQLTVTRRFAGGAVDDVTHKVTYLSDRNVATVDKGLVRVIGESGSVIVRAYDPNSDALVVATFNIVRPRIASIDVTPNAASLTRGATRQFQATATMNNGARKDVTNQVLWSSTNTAAAIVDNASANAKGLVTAIAPGDTSIVAMDSETRVEGRASVFVTGNAAQLVALQLTPNPAALTVGATQQFNAVGIFSDGSTRDVTKEVVWSSSRADIVAIEATGLARGVTAGDATITATGTVSSTTIRGSAGASVK